MDIIILAILIATGTFMLNAKEQRKRIALPVSYTHLTLPTTPYV